MQNARDKLQQSVMRRAPFQAFAEAEDPPITSDWTQQITTSALPGSQCYMAATIS